MDGVSIDWLRWQDWAGNACYVILAASYVVTNMFWLRALAVTSLGFESVYLYFGANSPLWVGIGWNVVFVTINVVMLVLLVRERMRLRLTESEAVLHRGLFADFDPLQFARLLTIGRWVDVPKAARLTIEGQPVDEVLVLARGLAKVDVAGRIVAILQPGAFIGEMSLVTNEHASATVTTLEPSHLFAVPKDKLQALLAKDPALQSGLHRLIGRDLATKLRSGWESIGG